MDKKDIDYSLYIKTDLSVLTNRQREIFQMKLEGTSIAQIAKQIGCSRQNVSSILKYAVLRLDGHKEKQGHVDKKAELGQRSVDKKATLRQGGVDYSKYATRDLSDLNDNERIALKRRISGALYREIAQEINCTTGVVGYYLQCAVAKLDGRYEELMGKQVARVTEYRKGKGKEIAKKMRKKNYEEHREERIKKMKEYNKKYYEQNRERILERQKELRK